MALNWLWNEKCGEATFRQKTENGTREYTCDLFKGNAYLIFIYRYEQDGNKMYTLAGFFCDRDHMKKMLGVDKRSTKTYGVNQYNTEYEQLTKIRLNLNMLQKKQINEIISAFTEAFDDITIELYKESEVA